MIYEHNDYRSYLRSSLSARVAKNPTYSLRAFAQKLGLSPAMLSLVHSGKRNLTPGHAMKIASKLGLSSKEADYFSLLVQFESSKSSEAKVIIQERLNQLNPKRNSYNLSLDAFAVISDWYHFPILQLLNVPDFQYTPPRIARKLGITSLEVESALARLERLGVLVKNEDGRYDRQKKDLKVGSSERNDALRSFHKQMLLKALDSIDSQTNKEKYIGSETIAIDSKQIPKASKMIADFFDQMNAFFETGKKPDEVYHFGIQLFRLTRREM